MTDKRFLVLYIGRNDNVHDRRFVEALLEIFDVKEMYTKNFDSKPLKAEVFFNVDLVVAGPLTDAICAIPLEIDLPILGISHAFDLNIEFKDYPLLSNIQRCTAIVSDCKHITKELRSVYNYKGKVFEIPGGCDPEYFSIDRVNFEYKPRILVTRNWFPVYRNDVILSALKMLETKGIDFNCTFVGSGPLLENRSKNHGALSTSSNIRFLGYQDQAGIRDEMSGSWIYVSAASSDGTSLSLLEAMAAGMICIVTDFPSNLEWIDNTVNGFTFPDGDYEALCSLIEQISSLSLEEKMEISRGAIAAVSRRGDWKENRKSFKLATQGMLGGSFETNQIKDF